MAGTRSSSRISSQKDSPRVDENKQQAGSKRKASTATKSPDSKSQKKEQKTLEETLPGQKDGNELMNEDGAVKKKSSQQTDENEPETESDIPTKDGIEKDERRAKEMPSNTLERGVIYFFIRGRVQVDEPESVKGVARSYFVLRPIPDNYKLGQGPLPDLQNARLFALPKKVLPKSHRDVFMAFVEQAGASVRDLKDGFLKGSEYETKTTGVRHTPEATPIGEGVYSITETGRNSRLSYMLTLPAELGNVQKEMGLANKGSYVISVKNPDQDGPANASLPQGPSYPKEFKEEFGGLRWLGNVQPKHLDYANAQILMIGEGYGDMGKAVQPTEEDEKSSEKETPAEEMEKLEKEDERRIEALDGEHAIYQDLRISKKDYPELKTTW